MKIIIFILIFLFSQIYLINFIWKNSFYLQKKIYPLESYFTLNSIDCSHQRVDKELIKYLVEDFGSLRNHLVKYQNGQLSSCSTGWQKFPYISEKITQDTNFRIASLTKIFTSYEILKLVNDSKIRLNDSFVNSISNFPKEVNDNRINSITLEHLLSHKSGFDRIKSLDVVMEQGKIPWCQANIYKLAEQKLDFNPGLYYAYDNRNSCLLGWLLEKKQNKNLQEIFNTYNFKIASLYKIKNEVSYDFRYSKEWTEEDLKKFDYKGLISSAGVVTSGKNFAIQLKKISTENFFNLKKILIKDLCVENEICENTGFNLIKYKNNKFLIKQGYMPSSISWVVYNAKGDFIVWLGSSSGKLDSNIQRDQIKYKLMDELID
ncbi:serine hydrolase domain-containing protein [Acinetobacter indicus]|uniref:serine hydrolase domain-containing protein n=1 Tax=Acinetobacter indicus TaxID=756892 RepID=UPI002576A515|nr:serine hydrolase domain-containing protein [Acinetobacter indicus]MDM1243440.1 beta-lactamase family protein [Acinetobacter indicus]MDM1287264.1 beta-lactamase family protein [Acinetobacter indicus]